MRLFLLLLALWLLLNESAAPGDVLLGAVAALLGTAAFRRLEPGARGVRRPWAMARLFMIFVADMARSTFAVARIVLGLAGRERTTGFITLPLELRHPGGLAVMACIITSTPGTVWVRYEAAESHLIIHVFDLVDEQAWIDLFKQRYEKRLMEIFE